jgi:hypothetical protein
VADAARAQPICAAFALGLLLVEGWRCARSPEVRVDGRAITSRADPFPLDLHRDQQIDVR